ncbi:hypothetical protein B0H17DRAFT_1125046 [Mycena rosella]|uniref:Uncharacterized protein n=1 Tax=Mycena rosella TaxID=1033263 RepID=A0AAD7GZE5_MYCRO|nr:hypothetical protein B0H17DRAFT_1125046 [Mycena rosella]
MHERRWVHCGARAGAIRAWDSGMRGRSRTQRTPGVRGLRGCAKNCFKAGEAKARSSLSPLEPAAQTDSYDRAVDTEFNPSNSCERMRGPHRQPRPELSREGAVIPESGNKLLGFEVNVIQYKTRTGEKHQGRGRKHRSSGRFKIIGLRPLRALRRSPALTPNKLKIPKQLQVVLYFWLHVRLGGGTFRSGVEIIPFIEIMGLKKPKPVGDGSSYFDIRSLLKFLSDREWYQRQEQTFSCSFMWSLNSIGMLGKPTAGCRAYILLAPLMRALSDFRSWVNSLAELTITRTKTTSNYARENRVGPRILGDLIR